MKRIIWAGILAIALSLAITIGAIAQTITLHHKYYDCQFDTIFCQGVLNDYWQTQAHYNIIKNGAKVDRKAAGKFKQDSLVPVRFQLVTQKDYDDYNKAHPLHKLNIGHEVPAQPMSFDLEALKETFYFGSNTGLQDGYFNQHQWAFVEGKVFALSEKEDSIHVFTGVLIDTNSVAVGHGLVWDYGNCIKVGHAWMPDWYFKVAVTKEGTKAWLGKNSSENTDTNPDDIVITVEALKAKIRAYYPNLYLPF